MNRLWFVIFGLVAVIVLLILFQPQPDDTKEKELQAKIELRDQAIFQLHREATAKTEKIKADSLKQVQERTTFQNAIGSLQARLRVKKVRIDTLILDNPSLAEYVATADSVIQMQSVRIDTLENNLKELRVDMAGLTFTFEQRLDLQSQTINDLEELTADQRKQLRKVRRQNKLLKVGVVIFGVGGLYLGSQF